ncbi:conserved hypothetical protein [Culex quinquefasciatus]|uniref:Uncharacterized protein n=1 Tax=Culex quinquefasciatus TaxID=7176 RepID=B0WAX6_CULQU|nr:conserved hypothetical protein [Culex quinquefasciatus]|eukprot:XP_001845860.1 conserved hypothetical protein [Culex quinquefasciatus]
MGSSSEHYSRQVLEYVTSLIWNLSEEEPGSFDCWFYENLEQPSEESMLDPIVTSDRLSLIPRRILYSEGSVKVSRSPSILVVFILIRSTIC